MGTVREAFKVHREFAMRPGNRSRWALLAVLVLTACAWGGAQRHIGQRLEPEDRHALGAPSGEHRIETNTFVFMEKYRLDRTAGRMYLGGRIQYTFDEDTHRVGAIINRFWIESVYVQALFADLTGKVIAVETFRLYPEVPIFYPVAFERDLSLPPGSEFVTFRLTTYLRDGGNRMVSRQINATQTEETGGVDHGGGGIDLLRGPIRGQSDLS